MNFMENLKRENNATLTTNGDVAYKSTFDANLDFFGQAGSKRGNGALVVDMFEKAFEENPLVAIMNLFQLRDISDGAGERQLTRDCLEWLADNEPKVFEGVVMSKYLELGRWDDITMFATHENVGEFVLEIVKSQLILDCKAMGANKPISLLAKWMPTESSKSNDTKKLARFLANKIFKGDYKLYRKVISELRQYIGILETYLTNKDYTFDYSKLPSRASIKYVKAFLRNDEERFNEYKQSLKVDSSVVEKKVGKLQLHEILKTGFRGTGCYNNILVSKEEVDYANILWDALPKDTLNKKCIVVRDGSGSMTIALPGSKTHSVLDVASALSIYMSERLTGEFKDKFITFSHNPRLVDLSNCNTMTEKALKTFSETEVADTDIEKTYALIYKAALKSDPADVPDYVLIVSDMEFNEATGCSWKNKDPYAQLESTLDKFKRKFAEAGMKCPQMIFWNLNVHRAIFPAQEKAGNIFVSGFSKALFDKICNMEEISTDASQFMLDALEPKYLEMAKSTLEYASEVR